MLLPTPKYFISLTISSGRRGIPDGGGVALQEEGLACGSSLTREADRFACVDVYKRQALYCARLRIGNVTDSNASCTLPKFLDEGIDL